MKQMLTFITFLVCLFSLIGCGKSDEEVNRISEYSYNSGYYDALDCVKRKGGSAVSAAKSCENE